MPGKAIYQTPHLIATPPLSDKGDGYVASSVTWQSHKSITIKSEKTVGNNVLHSLAVAYEGGLFSSGDLHFVWWNSFLMPSTFLAQHPLTWVAQEQCWPPLVNTGKACKWNNLKSLQGAKPIKKQTCLKDVFGRWCRSGKGFNPLCAAWGAFFFPSTLKLVWTFQPLFEIGMDMSIWTIRNSKSILILITDLNKQDFSPLCGYNQYDAHWKGEFSYFYVRSAFKGPILWKTCFLWSLHI